MFDMLLESGQRPSLLPSWGKGVAVTLHVLILGALWRAPASPAPATVVGPLTLPPLEPVTGKDNGLSVPIVVVDGRLPLPPLEIPDSIDIALRTLVMHGSFETHVVGGPALEPGDSVHLPSLVEDAPELLSAPMPTYPPLLRAAGVQGQVIVAAVVDTVGLAENGSVRIVRSDNPGFDAAALATVRAARFRPARIYGRVVRVLVQVPVVFRLN